MSTDIEALADLLLDSSEALEIASRANDFYYTFVPRPDQPELYDQQHSFVYDQVEGVAGLLGGNASGTSEAAAFKIAQFVLNRQPPTRRDLPFWVCGPKMDQVVKTFWKEKLYGHGHIPAAEIDWARIRWHSEKQGLPLSVPLLPWPPDRGGNSRYNWCLEFRSFGEGAAHMTAEAIGGFCCTEPFPQELLTEILRATRETDFPGSRFFELTPVDPAATYWLEEMIIEDRIPERWKLYRCNTQCNVDDPNSVVGKAWSDDFFSSVSDEMQETRKTGAFASYEGLIYQSFNRAIHVVDNMEIPEVDVFHKRAVDWGSSLEHPLACLFGYKDALGDWNIYAEYHSTDQTMVWADHCEAIRNLCKWKDNSPYFQQTYGDPSRPDLFKEFANNGIPVTAAKNAVYEGIESVRRAMKVHPARRVPQLRIARWCKQLIKEMFTYRWAKSSGHLQKAARPVPFKRADDCCFIEGTIVQLSSGVEKPIETLVRGDKVVTHLGEAAVLADAVMTGSSEVFRVTLDDGTELTGTGDHHVAVDESEWIPLKDLLWRNVNVLESRDLYLKSLEAEVASKSSNTPASGGDDTQTLPTEQPTATLSGRSLWAVGKSLNTFTGGFTRISSAIFQQEWMCTISTTILETISRGILKVYRHRSTRSTTFPMDARFTSRKIRLLQRSALSADVSSQWNFSIASDPSFVHENVSLSLFGKTSLALCAARKSISRRVLKNAKHAVGNVSRFCVQKLNSGCTRKKIETEPMIISGVTALSVESQSPAEARKRARKRVTKKCVVKFQRMPGKHGVYNIATEHGTFFANGILVSNCDALRYLIHTDYTGGSDIPTRGWVEPRRRPQIRHKRTSRRG